MGLPRESFRFGDMPITAEQRGLQGQGSAPKEQVPTCGLGIITRKCLRDRVRERARTFGFGARNRRIRRALHQDFRRLAMTRTVALRASTIFVTLALLFGALAFSSQAAVASALFVITGSVCAVMLLFAAAPPQHALVPVRVRRTLR